MNIEILRVLVLVRKYGPDLVSLETRLPSGAYPFTGFAWADITVASETGEAYAKEHFPGIELEIINIDPL